MSIGLPFCLQDYLKLMDWSGRCLRAEKRGAIDGKLPPILKRLQIDPRHRLYLNKHFESRFKSLLGTAHSVRSACERLGKRWVAVFAIASATYLRLLCPDFSTSHKKAPPQTRLDGATVSEQCYMVSLYTVSQANPPSR